MKIAEQIGARIRTLRKARGLSQMAVAHKAGLATSYYSGLERGEKNPTIQTLAQVSDALGVSFDSIVASDLVEVEQLLADIPPRQRPAMTRMIREAVLVIREASREAGRAGRRN